MFYDPAKNTLNLNAVVGETKSDSDVLIQRITQTKTVYSHRDIPVDKPLQNWKLVLMIIGAATVGYFALRIALFVRSKVQA